MEKIILKLTAFDHRILDMATKEIITTVKRSGAKVAGAIPLPTACSRYTVLKSTHVDKKSREQFEIRIHKRLIHIVDPNSDTIISLSKIVIPAGVEIEIKT